MQSPELYSKLYSILPADKAGSIERYAISLFGGISTYPARRDAYDYSTDFILAAQFKVSFKRALRKHGQNVNSFFNN